MKNAIKLPVALFGIVSWPLFANGCDGKIDTTGAASGGMAANTPCEDGTERCACYGNGTCNAGLTCASNLCVRLALPAAGGATSTALSQGGSVTIGQGGAVLALASGGLPGVGGWQGAGGAAASTGGVTSLGGTAGAPAATCSAWTNLIADALASTDTNWIGGDPSATLDNPCGVQGSVYAYSDKGLDGVTGGPDASVQSPALDTAAGGENRLSPCSAKNGCCISGKTSRWPVSGTTTDYTASVWGGGLGVSLNDPSAGGTWLAYVGPIRGFNVTVSGTLNGQVLRVGYRQSATDLCAPFVQQSAVGTFAVPFTGLVVCPTWACTPACIPPTSRPYALEVQVVGGDVAGAFNICVTSITPIL